MRNLALIGVVLITIGIVGLAVGHFSYTETKRVADIGPIKINSQEEHRIPFPEIAGILAVLSGLVLVVVSRRSV